MERPNVNDEKYKLSPDFQVIKFDINAYQADINKHIDQVEAENKDANQFIIQVADLLGINTDGIGFDELRLSIEDFEEAINKLKPS